MLLQDDPLLDVLVFLCRAVLDALEITNRRFKVLVQKHTKGICLRGINAAELWADADMADMPVNNSKVVTAPARHRDGGLQSETFSLEDVTVEEICRWFANRLRYTVIADQLKIAVPTDSPSFLENVKGTVHLKKGLCWAVAQAIDLNNASRFLKCRVLRTVFDEVDPKTLKANVEQIVEAAVGCVSTHSTTFVLDDVDWEDVDELIDVLAKYKNSLQDYIIEDNNTEEEFEDDEGNECRGRVFNFCKERFRIQIFLQPNSRGLQIRRAHLDKVEDGFFPAYLEAPRAISDSDDSG